MINKILLYKNKGKLYLSFLDVMGLMQIKDKNILYNNRTNDYNNKIKFLAKYEHIYKEVGFDIELEIIFNFVKLKLSMLNNELNLTEDLLKIIKKNIYDMSKIDNRNKDLFIYLHNLLEVSYKSILLISSINEKKFIIEKEMEDNNVKIKKLINDYSLLEVNSKEYLLLSAEHLELVFNNAKLKTKEDIIVDEDISQKGENIIYALDILISKLIQSKRIIREGKELIVKNEDFGMLYSLVLAEKIKLKFYLGEKFDKLFNDVADLVSLQITLKNKDPLSFAMYNTIGEDIYSVSIYEKNSMFDKYIKSFVVEIYELKNNLVRFNLKQFSNFTAKNKMERLKFIKVN
jgi:hypothetical protein